MRGCPGTAAREVPAFVGRGARGEGEVVLPGHLQASDQEQDGPQGDCSSPANRTAASPPGQLPGIIVELDEATMAALEGQHREPAAKARAWPPASTRWRSRSPGRRSLR
jgi:hypothetical protein